jgi:hypothetical protein
LVHWIEHMFNTLDNISTYQSHVSHIAQFCCR